MSETQQRSNLSKKDCQEKYHVVKSIEDQYSIWPQYKQIPLGWESIGELRSKEECLNYIEEAWIDMRPLSLRKKMEQK